MKKILFFLTAISIFSNCKNNSGTPSVSTVVSDTAAVKSGMLAGSKVVFVNLDSLQEKYTWFKQQKANFEQREKSLAASLDAKAQQFQNEYIALQEKAQKGTVPPAQLQQEGQALQAKQQNIVNERDRKTKELLDESQKFNENLQKKLSDVLKGLQAAKGFDYVVSYSKNGGSPFLYVNETLDITNEVLAILNAEKAN